MDDENFIQLLKLNKTEESAVTQWLSKRASKCTSHEQVLAYLEVIRHPSYNHRSLFLIGHGHLIDHDCDQW